MDDKDPDDETGSPAGGPTLAAAPAGAHPQPPADADAPTTETAPEAPANADALTTKPAPVAVLEDSPAASADTTPPDPDTAKAQPDAKAADTEAADIAPAKPEADAADTAPAKPKADAADTAPDGQTPQPDAETQPTEAETAETEPAAEAEAEADTAESQPEAADVAAADVQAAETEPAPEAETVEVPAAGGTAEADAEAVEVPAEVGTIEARPSGEAEREAEAESEPDAGPPADEAVDAEPEREAEAESEPDAGPPADEAVEAEPEGEAEAEGGRPAGEAEEAGEEPRRRWWGWRPRRARAGVGERRRVAMVAAVPVLAVLLVVAGWGVDQAASSGQALRNIDIAGRAVGGLDEATVRATVARLADEQDRWPVTIRSGEAAYESTAADLGITVDRDATVAAVLDAGRDGSQALRPFRWAGSFVHSHEVQVRYSADLLRTAMTLEAVQGADRTAPVEPTMQLSDNGFVLAPGQPGRGLAPGRVAAQLLDAMASRSDDLPDSASDEPLVLDGEPVALPTTYDDADVQLLADQANAMTAAGLTITAGPAQVTVPAGQLRPWIRLATSGDQLQLAIDSEAALAALPEVVGSVGETAVNATVTLDGAGAPVVVPSRNGVACCQDDSATRIWDALQNGQSEVELDIREMEPEWTTEEVQAWGITQPVGGNRGWQSGHEIEGPAPGFTTYHDCCASRVTNIHRLADLVRGAVIPPGGDFSINDYVGPRTADDGFVLAGAIADGRHVEEIGGGVSQFATTTFNAAYFAGLDIVSYQAHSEYFSRYPRGREATMGYPLPDLAIHNNTPYGILIWTSYTGTSLTVTLYSTPYATAEQTGISESSYGACRNVSTTRTRTFPDGTTTTDTFRATYRPGEGRTC